jgi:hypothetical protein
MIAFGDTARETANPACLLVLPADRDGSVLARIIMPEENLRRSVGRGASLVESGHRSAKLHRLVGCLAVVYVFPRWLRD